MQVEEIAGETWLRFSLLLCVFRMAQPSAGSSLLQSCIITVETITWKLNNDLDRKNVNVFSLNSLY